MDEIEKLYQAVSKKGLYTKSIDEFRTKYSTMLIVKAFNVVAREGLYTKTKEEFNTKFPLN
jgi:hypothetical protein